MKINSNKRIFLSPPYMSGLEKDLLLNAFNSNWIAPTGPELDSFEEEVSKYLNVDFCCALSSGTSALHLAMRLIGISKKDIVLCPSLTFVASANAIMYESAIPVFIDSNPNFWTLETGLLEKSIKKYKPKAIIAVDIYGQSCDYDRIIKICDKYNVHIIEDSAEALGSTYKGKKLGTFGSMGVLSFNGNKIITTSGGGMLISSDKSYIEKAKFLSTQSREPFLHYEHKEIGYNYRLSNILAAIGRGQLKSIDTFVNKRRKIFDHYYKQLSCFEGIKFMSEPNYCRGNRWLTTLTINETKTGFSRDDLIKRLEVENIESRPVWKPMHLQPLFKDFEYVKQAETDVSLNLYKNGICLPSGSNLSIKDQNCIIDIVKSLFK